MNFTTIKKYLKSDIVHSGSIFGTSVLILTSVTLLYNTLIIKWLSPSQLGKWQAISLIQVYIVVLQFGVTNGLNRELPILLGKNRIKEANSLNDTAQTFIFIICSIIVIITFISVLILTYYHIEKEYIIGILTIGITTSLSIYQNYLLVTFRSSSTFTKMAKVNLLYSVFLIACVYIIYKFNYYGLLIFNLITTVFYTIFTYRSRPFKSCNFIIKGKELKCLIKNGITLMGFNQLKLISQSMPKILILQISNITLLGLFSPALATISIFNILPNSIAQFIHPQLSYLYGKNGSTKKLLPHIKNIYWILFFVSIPLAIFIWILTPIIIQNYFPKYYESITAIRIMSVAFIFSSSYTTHGIIFTIKAYKYALIYSLCELIGSIIFPLIIYQFKSDVLKSISLGILVNNILLFIINYKILNFVLNLPKYNNIST